MARSLTGTNNPRRRLCSHYPRASSLRVREDLMSLQEHQPDIVRDVVARVLIERGIAAPSTTSQAILDCLISAPEAVKLDLIHRLVDGRQCLVCGDFIHP